jgi:GT2 family glycosyltransferase
MSRGVEFVQFLDGDCEVSPDWLENALAAALAEPDLAAVFGRRRERFPDRSVYNRMCDEEWNVPVGLAASCGGDALFRSEALVQADGYSDDLIAGEEPDICLRLRQMGWRIRRIDAEMTLHDAAIYKFSSWWKRAERSGFAYAEHMWRHGRKADPQWRRQVLSIIGWTLLLPAAAVLILSSYAVAHLLATLIAAFVGLGYGLQVIRIARRKHAKGAPWHFALSSGTLIVLGKFAEFSGVAKCWISHILRRQHALIEYKDAR